MVPAAVQPRPGALLDAPIENAISKLRWLCESAGHRTIDALWRNTQAMLDAITPSDARGFFRHAGYEIAT